MDVNQVSRSHNSPCSTHNRKPGELSCSSDMQKRRGAWQLCDWMQWLLRLAREQWPHRAILLRLAQMCVAQRCHKVMGALFVVLRTTTAIRVDLRTDDQSHDNDDERSTSKGADRQRRMVHRVQTMKERPHGVRPEGEESQSS